MLKKTAGLAIAMLVNILVFSQEGFYIRGRIIGFNDKPLIGVNVVVGQKQTGTYTDKDGQFSLGPLTSGTYLLMASYIGFVNYQDSIKLKGNTLLNIRLQPEIVTLSEVSVTDSYAERRRATDARPVEVVDEQYLRMNLSGSLMQSLERLPGISTIDIGSGQSKPVIRGLGFNQVVVAENGIKHESQQWGADHGVEIDQFGVERIEVIKGPGSLMYGSDAIGGVIDLKTPAIPLPRSLSGTLDLSGRSNNKLGAVSLGLSGRNNKFWTKARLTLIDYADYKVPTDSVEYYSYYFKLKDRQLRNSAGEEQNGSITAGWAGKSFNSALSLSNTFSKSGFFANAHGLEIRTSTIDYDRSDRDIDLPYQQVNHLKIQSKNSYWLNNINYQLDAAYQKNNRQEFSEAVEHGYMPRPPDSLERKFLKDTWSLNLMIKGPESDKISLSGGINTELQHNRTAGWGFIIPAFDKTMAGIYLISNARISKKLLFQAGMRFDAGNIRIQQYIDWFVSPTEDNDAIFEYKERALATNRTFSNLSWSAGAIYHSNEISLKANLGKSFRMPLAKELASDGVNYHMYRFEKGNPGLEAEIAYQLDFGFEWNHRLFAVEITPFAGYFPNYIYLNPTYQYYEGLQVFNYEQSEVARAGGEFHLHYKITPRLKSGVIGELVWARQLSGDKKGFGLPWAPPASLLLNLSYNPVKIKGLTEPVISIDYQLVAAQNQIVPPERKTPGYGVVNLSAGTKIYAWKQSVSINVQVVNLTNRRYLSHTSFYRLIGVPEQGRSLILSIQIPLGDKQNE